MPSFKGTERYGSPLRLFDLGNLDLSRRYYNEAQIRGLAASSYLGEGRLICRVLGRYKMFVDELDIGLTPHLILDGYWEMWLTEALSDIVKPGMVVADVGANLGYFSLLMADRVGANGVVHAFEPNPRLADRMNRTIALNGFRDRVVIHEQALADTSEEFEFICDEAEPKNGYLLPPRVGGTAPRLMTRRLDSFPELEKLDVVKIDADTSEQRIWSGMEAIFAASRSMTVFLEFALARYADPGLFIDDIQRHGFGLEILTLNEGIKSITRSEILGSSPHEDIMLVLRR